MEKLLRLVSRKTWTGRYEYASTSRAGQTRCAVSTIAAAASVFITQRNLFNNLEMVQLVTTDSAALCRKGRWKRIACYLPLAALALEFVWIFLLFIALIFAVGDTPYVNTPEKSNLMSWLSSLPAAAGLLLGLIGILTRLPVKTVDWVFLIAGTAGCAGLFFLCTSGIW